MRGGGARCKENQCWNYRQKSKLLYLPLSMNFLFLYSLCYSELHQRQQSPSVGENRRDCRNCFSFAKKLAVYVQCDGWYLSSFVENIRDSKDYTVVLFISQRGDILKHDVLRSVVCWSVSKDKFCGVTWSLSGQVKNKKLLLSMWNRKQTSRSTRHNSHSSKDEKLFVRLDVHNSSLK